MKSIKEYFVNETNAIENSNKIANLFIAIKECLSSEIGNKGRNVNALKASSLKFVENIYDRMENANLVESVCDIIGLDIRDTEDYGEVFEVIKNWLRL